jgi:hypothetical protein
MTEVATITPHFGECACTGGYLRTDSSRQPNGPPRTRTDPFCRGGSVLPCCLPRPWRK